MSRVSFHEFPPAPVFAKALILGAAVAVRQAVQGFSLVNKTTCETNNLVNMVKKKLHDLEFLFLFVGMEVVKVRMR